MTHWLKIRTAILLCLGLPFSLAAQHCGTAWANPQPAPSFSRNYNHTLNRTSSGDTLIIPLVFHIVYFSEEENIPDARIVSQLNALNMAYNSIRTGSAPIPAEFRDRAADIGFYFCLASLTPDNQPASGIVRVRTSHKNIGTTNTLFSDQLGGSSPWDTRRYVNIWIAATNDSLLGYSIYPWNAQPGKDGIVIDPRYIGANQHPRFNLGKTLVHEMGHYFGLFHLWRDDEDCSTDDEVADTPPQKGPYYHCPSYPQYSCDVSNMFMNYMDYVDDGCMQLFTEGQKERMLAIISRYRATLPGQPASVRCFPYPNAGSSFMLYPNPAATSLSIKLTLIDYSGAALQVWDATGRRIYYQPTLPGAYFTIDISGWPKGIYLIRIGDQTSRFVHL